MIITDTPFLTLVIVSIGVIIRALQDLCLKKELFINNIFDWRYCLVSDSISKPLDSHSSIKNIFFSFLAFLTICILTLIAVPLIVLIFLYHPDYALWGILILLSLHYYVRYRIRYAMDGSDNMAFLVLICLLIMTLDTGSGEYIRLGAAALAIHTALSYYTSGLSKITSNIWRSGEGLIGVMNTAEFGNDFMARILGNNLTLSKILSWMMMCGHIFTGTMILLGGPFIYAAIGVSLFFHCMIAVLMRLNSFVWAFAATYPSLIFIADWNQRTQLWDDIMTAFGY